MCPFASRQVAALTLLADLLSMANHQEEIQNIILKLNSLTKDLEILIQKSNETNESRRSNGSNLRDRRIESAPPGHVESDSSTSSLENMEVDSEMGFQRNKALNVAVKLNVDGLVFFASWAQMRRLPESRLGKIADSHSLADALQNCDHYNSTCNEFFFYKRNKNFGEILEFYRTGSLHISDDNCVIAFDKELGYWGISSDYLEICCLKRFSEAKDLQDGDDQSPSAVHLDVFPPGTRGRLQKYCWDLFENPHTSYGARAVAIISVLSIVLATIVLTLNTLPYFQEKEDKIGGDYAVFAIMEAVYISWFTLEFVVRLICCPDKKRFVCLFMNWIDFLAIVPYFISLFMYATGIIKEDEEMDGADGQDEGANSVLRIAQIFRLLRIVKTLRIIRIFKLARHSTGLQALGYTFKSNYRELGLLILFLGMGAIMFSSLTYVFENDAGKKTTFKTMLDAYWWAIITMTTIGYGDVVPITWTGKAIGTCCAIFGVLVIGLPIPIIGSSFNNFYAREKRREKVLQRESRVTHHTQRSRSIQRFSLNQMEAQHLSNGSVNGGRTNGRAEFYVEEMTEKNIEK